MKQVYEERDEKKKRNIVTAMIFSALIVLGGVGLFIVSAFVGGNGVVVVNAIAITRNGVQALSIVGHVALDTTSIDVSNTTSQMTTLFVTLIAVMIPLIIIMAYLGIFQDFIGAISRGFGGLFGRRN